MTMGGRREGQERTSKDVSNTKNTPMWMCFSRLVGRGGEGNIGLGGWQQKGGGRGQGAGYLPNTKKCTICGTFFMFGSRIAAEHKQRATNGAFFMFGRWEGGGETGGVGSYRRTKYPPNMKNANTITFFVFGQRIAAKNEKHAANGAFFHVRRLGMA